MPVAHALRQSLIALLAVLVGLPLIWSVWSSLAGIDDAAAWTMLLQHPQTLPALGQTLWTGLASTLLACVITGLLLARSFSATRTAERHHRLGRLLAPMLSVPHAAFAIGVVALIAPSGWIFRMISPWPSGLEAPPAWPTTQDPWGLGLIAVLALKEIPFLLWAALAYLEQPGMRAQLQQALRLAATWGYSESQAWWRIGWPQLLRHLTTPLLAVLVYSLTVVDMGLIIGPNTPPTLAMLAWQWLQDADAAVNQQGTLAACLLTGVLVLCTALVAGLRASPLWRHLQVRGVRRPSAALKTRPQADPVRETGSGWLLITLVWAYGAVLLALAIGSVSGPWPFPRLLPETWTLNAWRGVGHSSATLWSTLWLAGFSAATALVWVVAWMEWASARWQRRLRPVWLLPLVLPGVLWVVGLHRMGLAWGIDGQAAGLWLAHTLACVPYVLIALQGPYGGFDARLQHVSATLGHSRATFLRRVKWPLLRGALTAAFAIGFAVSVAQYLPTLYVGAGRFQTVTTEAVNLAAGGQRSLTAAFAWLQWLLPVLVFGLASRLGRARRWPGAAQSRP